MNLAQRAETNALASLRAYASAAGGTITETATLLAVTAPANMRPFNQILLKRLHEDDAAELTETVRRYEGRKARLRSLETAVGDNEPLILAAGLERQGGIPSLALTSVDLAPSTVPIDIREVTDEPTLAHHVALVADSFDFDVGNLSTVFSSALLDDPAWHAYVGYVDNEPVATTQLVIHEGVAGIYYVGTPEAHRARGYADALTRHAIIQGAGLGCDIATLQASPAGYPVYRRMGFEDVGYYRTYVRTAHEV